MAKQVAIMILCLIGCTYTVYADFQLGNGKYSVPLGQGQGIEVKPIEQDEQVTEVIIENNTEQPVEEVTEKYVRQDQVIKINLDVAQIVVYIGLIAIIIGIIMCLRVANPYNLPSIIQISSSKQKYFRKYKNQQVTEQKIPLKGDIASIYLLSLQSSLIGLQENYFTDEELLSATEWLCQQGKIKYTVTQKKVKIYRLSKFGEQDIKEIIGYMNYLEFAIRNNNLRQEDLEFVDLFGLR